MNLAQWAENAHDTVRCFWIACWFSLVRSVCLVVLGKLLISLLSSHVKRKMTDRFRGGIKEWRSSLNSFYCNKQLIFPHEHKVGKGNQGRGNMEGTGNIPSPTHRNCDIVLSSLAKVISKRLSGGIEFRPHRIFPTSQSSWDRTLYHPFVLLP